MTSMQHNSTWFANGQHADMQYVMFTFCNNYIITMRPADEVVWLSNEMWELTRHEGLIYRFHIKHRLSPGLAALQEAQLKRSIRASVLRKQIDRDLDSIE